MLGEVSGVTPSSQASQESGDSGHDMCAGDGGQRRVRASLARDRYVILPGINILRTSHLELGVTSASINQVQPAANLKLLWMVCSNLRMVFLIGAAYVQNDQRNPVTCATYRYYRLLTSI
jgi:hypothetical protein